MKNSNRSRKPQTSKQTNEQQQHVLLVRKPAQRVGCTVFVSSCFAPLSPAISLAEREDALWFHPLSVRILCKFFLTTDCTARRDSFEGIAAIEKALAVRKQYKTKFAGRHSNKTLLPMVEQPRRPHRGRPLGAQQEMSLFFSAALSACMTEDHCLHAMGVVYDYACAVWSLFTVLP